jgi:hypothetical protein
MAWWSSALEKARAAGELPPGTFRARAALRDGRYALVAATTGPFTAERPFIVSIAPARLTDGLHH